MKTLNALMYSTLRNELYQPISKNFAASLIPIKPNSNA